MIKGKIVLDIQKLGLVEAYNNKFKSTSPTSYFRGTHQIDGIWCAHSIVSTEVSISLFNFDEEEHIVCAVGFQMKSIIGDLQITLCLPNKKTSYVLLSYYCSTLPKKSRSSINPA